MASTYRVLNEDKVIAIRRDHKKGTHQFGVLALARKYNVSRNTIRLVLAGRTWKRVKQ